jgi:hypothetical protein
MSNNAYKNMAEQLQVTGHQFTTAAGMIRNLEQGNKDQGEIIKELTKGRDDLLNRNQGLEKMVGKQSTEVGELRRMNRNQEEIIRSQGQELQMERNGSKLRQDVIDQWGALIAQQANEISNLKKIKSQHERDSEQLRRAVTTLETFTGVQVQLLENGNVAITRLGNNFR